MNTIDQQWEQLRLALQLSADERLILREVFQQNRKVTEVARALNLPEHQVRRQCKRAVARLRDVLVAAGISSEVLQDSEG